MNTVVSRILHLVLLCLIMSSVVNAQKEVRTHIFGHSLINFVSEDFPNHHTATPYWVSEFSREANHTYEMSGQWGQLHEHRNLNVSPQWGLTDVDGAWDEDLNTFDEIDFTGIIIMPSNFDQYFPPDENFEGTNYSNVSATIEVFDWCINQHADLELFIYEHWPEMSSNLLEDSTGWAAYNEVIQSSYHDWFTSYHEAISNNYPNSCISMIPLGPIISDILLTAPYNQIPLNQIYADPDPHGTPNLYFLAGMITYMALYEERVPSSYIPPSFIHPDISNNYTELVEFIWSRLEVFDHPDGESKVFCSEDMTTNDSDISLDQNGITFHPNPCDEIIVIDGTLSNFSIDILDNLGQVQQSVNHNNQSASIDISDLPNGVYFLRIRNESNNDLWVETMIKM